MDSHYVGLDVNDADTRTIEELCPDSTTQVLVQVPAPYVTDDAQVQTRSGPPENNDVANQFIAERLAQLDAGMAAMDARQTVLNAKNVEFRGVIQLLSGRVQVLEVENVIQALGGTMQVLEGENVELKGRIDVLESETYQILIRKARCSTVVWRSSPILMFLQDKEAMERIKARHLLNVVQEQLAALAKVENPRRKFSLMWRDALGSPDLSERSKEAQRLLASAAEHHEVVKRFMESEAWEMVIEQDSPIRLAGDKAAHPDDFCPDDFREMVHVDKRIFTLLQYANNFDEILRRDTRLQ